METRSEIQSSQDETQLSRLPILCGADIELGNFILGLERADGTSHIAATALLREIEGIQDEKISTRSSGGYSSSRGNYGYGSYASQHEEDERPGGQSKFNPQDWGRKFLPANGGCAYIDLEHLELCVPEVISAWDHVACWHAMLNIAGQAATAANAKLPPGQKTQVLVNNSDGKGNSYGSHLNFLITRQAWDNIFRRRIHYLLFLASFQASSIVYTGQGKVGSENGTAPVEFQISQRADFFETLMGPQTTYHRPLVNSRDEPLCGRRSDAAGDEDPSETMARLHVIFFDNTLCHVSSLLKVGVMQIVLAMIEAGQINLELVLEDPVEAAVSWSHDPQLEDRQPLISGKEVTAVELQFQFLADAKEFVAAGGCEGIVPRAEEILALWEDTLTKLAAKDYAALAPRLDWVLKLSILSQVMERGDLSWDSPQIKHLDHMYSNLDRAEGLYWAYETSDFVERVVSADDVNRFTVSPPEDTRAWSRSMLLRWAGEESVTAVNWDRMEFALKDEGEGSRRRILSFADPLGGTRAATEQHFRDAVTLDELLRLLGAREGKVRDGNNQALAQYNGGYGASWPLNTFEKQLLARALWNWRPSN
jgi:proteasome accessory factor A